MTPSELHHMRDVISQPIFAIEQLSDQLKVARDAAAILQRENITWRGYAKNIDLQAQVTALEHQLDDAKRVNRRGH